MKSIYRYLMVIVGCLFIAISLNFIIIPNELIPFGINGLSTLIYYINNVNVALNIFLINLAVVVLATIYLDKNIIKVYSVPSLLIPLFVFLTSPLTKYITFALPEMVLVVLVAGVLSGLGYSLIYKQGFSAGTIFLAEELVGRLTRFHSKNYSWILDIINIVIITSLFGYQNALYSLMIILISKYMITRTRFGINDSKMFYIITSKENEVKDFIIRFLKYEITVLDVKGGFTKKDKRILLTVIDTKDYFKLKEGIKTIDKSAFIAITDTYDVVNKKQF